MGKIGLGCICIATYTIAAASSAAADSADDIYWTINTSCSIVSTDQSKSYELERTQLGLKLNYNSIYSGKDSMEIQAEYGLIAYYSQNEQVSRGPYSGQPIALVFRNNRTNMASMTDHIYDCTITPEILDLVCSSEHPNELQWVKDEYKKSLKRRGLC